MSTSRRYVSPHEGKRGPGGRLLCRECGTETRPPRRTFCSDPCVRAWNERDTSYQRVKVLERDQGVCVHCFLDCAAIEQELNRLGWLVQRGRDAVENLKRFRAMIERYRIPRHKHGFCTCNSLWEMDHIVPVAEGGGGCGLENLRTLCWACHLEETRALQRRLAENRKRGIIRA